MNCFLLIFMITLMIATSNPVDGYYYGYNRMNNCDSINRENINLRARLKQATTRFDILRSSNVQLERENQVLKYYKRQCVTELQNTKADLMSSQQELASNKGGFKPQDCEELLGRGTSTDGVYTIYPNGVPIEVYCDMTNGGWIILQKRTDGSVDYNRDFVDYEQGFGDVSGEHWLGLEKMHTLTMNNSTNYILRIEMSRDDEEARWVEYSGFRITAGSDYALTFNETTSRGTLGDDLNSHNNMKFSARDKDVDTDRTRNCAVEIGGGGGWWYTMCISFTTTGMTYKYGNPIYTYLRRYDEPRFKSAIIKMKRA